MTSEFPTEAHDAQAPGLATVFTLVVWTTCLAAGALEIWLPYPQQHALARAAPPIAATLINVDLSQQPATAEPSRTPALSPQSEPPPPAAPLAPAPQDMKLTQEPALSPLAAVIPKFVKPVQMPVIPIAPGTQQAVRVVDAAPITPAAPAVRRLTFGQGEGRQPPPDYPLEAQMGGEEGTVVIRMEVGEDGRVVSAEATVASAWPLLNQAALRTVRENWRFVPGPRRIYEVSIRYQRR